MNRARVLIVRGGFGGIYAALQLEKELARGAPLDLTLVTRENFFLFTPRCCTTSRRGTSRRA